LWEGWYPALTLAHGVCVIVYVEADVDEGGLRLQASTDCVACDAAPQQHQSPPPVTRHNPQGATPRHGEGGQSHCRTAVTCHTAGCGLRPGPAPADVRPAVAAPHDPSPVNNNRPEEMRTSCCQQPAPPPYYAAKMSPRISIGPETRPGRPCPVPACSGQPLPGERRFSSALGNRVLVKGLRVYP
jgi:hypothetical protein